MRNLFFAAIAKGLISYGKRKLRAIGIEQVVDALEEYEDCEVGCFHSDGLCLWHQAYDFPIAIRACEECNSYIVVDPVLIGKQPWAERCNRCGKQFETTPSDKDLREVTLALAYVRSKLVYQAQLTPEAMIKSLGMIKAYLEQQEPHQDEQVCARSMN